MDRLFCVSNCPFQQLGMVIFVETLKIAFDIDELTLTALIEQKVLQQMTCLMSYLNLYLKHIDESQKES